MRGKRFLVVVPLALVAIGAAGFLVFRPRKPAEAGRAPAPAAAVFTGTEITLPGTVRAQSVVPVAVPVEGTVQEITVESGQMVYEGQLLGRIKNTGLENEEQTAAAELERADARQNQLESQVISARLESSRARADATRVQGEFDRLERVYNRQKILMSEGATPRLVFEKAQKDYEAAKLERDSLAALARAADDRLTAINKALDAARLMAADRTSALDTAREHAALAELHSPADGLVLAVTKRAGEEVTPDIKDLFQIAVNLAILDAVVQPEPPVLTRVRTGEEAMLTFAGLPDAVPGRVRTIEGTNVIVVFTSPNAAIRPGDAVYVRIRFQ